MGAPDVRTTWDYDPFAVPMGATDRVRWAFAAGGHGVIHALPLVVIAGQEPGPTGTLVAGVHGDEFEGPPALWRLAEEIRPSALHGRLFIVPVAHVAAFAAGQRVSPVDGANLARVFPGDPDGTVTIRLAHRLFHDLVARSDFVVDCHSGGVRLLFAPVAGFYAAGGAIAAEASRASLALARALALPHLWSMPHRDGVLTYEAAKRGIAAAGAEIGGGGGRLERDSELYRLGLRGCLQAWGMLAEAAPTPPEHGHVLDGDWQAAPVGGFIETHVALGARVSQGDRIATIRDAFGGELEEMTAPCSGVVLGVRHLCSIEPGEPATCVVEERPL